MRTLGILVAGALGLVGLLAGPSPACTSFCLHAPGGPVFGTNLDLTLGEGLVFVNPRGLAKQGIQPNTAGETASWVSRYGSVTFNLAGRELAWGGMNEAGLAMSSMQLSVSVAPEPDERFPFDPGSLVQYVLDTSGTVGEALRRISEVRLADAERSPTQFLLADAAGNCAVVESLAGELVRYTGEDLPVCALANATYDASIAFVDRGIVPEFNPGASVERVAAAHDAIRRYRADADVPPVEYAFAILTEAVAAPRSWWSDLFREPYTRWNVVFDLEQREVHFRTVESPGEKRLSLSAFDFSCTQPAWMLDVNTDAEGVVEGAFTPYDHAANLGVFRSFCKRWGIEISKKDAEGLVRFFESFECAEMES